MQGDREEDAYYGMTVVRQKNTGRSSAGLHMNDRSRETPPGKETEEGVSGELREMGDGQRETESRRRERQVGRRERQERRRRGVESM